MRCIYIHDIKIEVINRCFSVGRTNIRTYLEPVSKVADVVNLRSLVIVFYIFRNVYSNMSMSVFNKNVIR